MGEEMYYQHPFDGDKSILQEEKQIPVFLVSSKSSGHGEGLRSKFATFLSFIIFTIAVKPVNSGLPIDYKPHFSSCEGNLPEPSLQSGSFAAGNNVSKEISGESYLCFLVKIFVFIYSFLSR